MKKNKNRQSRTRLQSIDNAQLAQVAGGETMEELRNKYQPGSGWWEFYNAAAANDGVICTPRWY